MKVVMLIWDYWPLAEGGAQRQCRAQARALSGRGVDCTILTQRATWSARRVQQDGETSILRLGLLVPLATHAARFTSAVKRRLRKGTHPAGGTPAAGAGLQRAYGFTTPWLWLARLSFMVEAAGFLFRRRKTIDLLHIHEATWLAGFGAWIAGKLRIPALCKEATYPVLQPFFADTPFHRRLSAARLQAHYLAMTPEIRAALIENGIPENRIHPLPNGVEIPPETAASAQNGLEVLYVGNLYQGAHWKAFDVLIEAWSLVAQKNPAARLTLVGGGDPAPWRRRAEQLQCASTLRFTGPSRDVGAHYTNSAIFVLPSRVEGMSNALLEAQSWGLPAVVSDIPGNRAIVQHERNGILVPVGDAAALSDGILRLLANPALRAQMGSAARARMEAEFRMEIIAERLLTVYEAVAKTSDRRYAR